MSLSQGRDPSRQRNVGVRGSCLMKAARRSQSSASGAALTSDPKGTPGPTMVQYWADLGPSSVGCGHSERKLQLVDLSGGPGQVPGVSDGSATCMSVTVAPVYSSLHGSVYVEDNLNCCPMFVRPVLQCFGVERLSRAATLLVKGRQLPPAADTLSANQRSRGSSRRGPDACVRQTRFHPPGTSIEPRSLEGFVIPSAPHSR